MTSFLKWNKWLSHQLDEGCSESELGNLYGYLAFVPMCPVVSNEQAHVYVYLPSKNVHLYAPLYFDVLLKKAMLL